MRYYFQVGTCIYQTQVFTAEAGTVIIYYSSRNFTHCFIGIYKGIEKRIA